MNLLLSLNIDQGKAGNLLALNQFYKTLNKNNGITN